jgi:hypothetical protein
MPSAEKIDTHHKAVTLNLDPSTFGSFAEIGAGQEVARKNDYSEQKAKPSTSTYLRV